MTHQETNDRSVAVSADTTDPLHQVFCSTCQHEVPLSEVVVAEAVDYVVYFCGLDCYERWHAQAA
jgi:hypothetical protein